MFDKRPEVRHAEQSLMEEKWGKRKPYMMIIIGIVCYFAVILFLAILIANSTN